MKTAYDIINQPANAAVVEKFFMGIASGDYYNGMCYRLYLDLDDNSIRENLEASENSWTQRDDGSLVEIERISGYCDIPEDEQYTGTGSLTDYGYGEWLDMIESRIAEYV